MEDMAKVVGKLNEPTPGSPGAQHMVGGTGWRLCSSCSHCNVSMAGKCFISVDKKNLINLMDIFQQQMLLLYLSTPEGKAIPLGTPRHPPGIVDML